MAGIVDIRYNLRTRRWTAKPRFSYDRESMLNGAPSAEGIDPAGAVYALVRLLPEAMGNDLQKVCPERIYRSPEYEWPDDKCIEIDGSCPNREQWAERRANYLRRF